jgi:hypothetical protein
MSNKRVRTEQGEQGEQSTGRHPTLHQLVLIIANGQAFDLAQAIEVVYVGGLHTDKDAAVAEWVRDERDTTYKELREELTEYTPEKLQEHVQNFCSEGELSFKILWKEHAPCK